MTQYDLVVRGGLILDGSGQPGFVADVAISDGVIREVGRVAGEGRETLDASGKIVTPGFVDVHTHYDGQVTWEHTLAPSSMHGVTTVVMGNCGVGFAPCRPQDRDTLIKVMEGVEDVPEIVMTEGIPWQWETFPEYLEFLANRQYDGDCAAFLPHAAVRVFVMGERAASDQPSTLDDRRRMTELVVEAMGAGAMGVATSRVLFHRDSQGELAPHVKSGREEVLALAEGLRIAGRGTFQIVTGLLNQQLSDFDSDAAAKSLDAVISGEIALMEDLSRTSGRPVHFTLSDVHDAPHLYREVLERVRAINMRGEAEIRPQVFPRPVGLLFGLELSLHPFKLHPSYQPLVDLPLHEKVARMRDPALRARLLSESAMDHASPVQNYLVAQSLQAYPMGGEPDYEPSPEQSLPAIAARRGVSVEEAAYDALLEYDGRAILFMPMVNFGGHTLDAVHRMLVHPDTVLGLGDGGAHYGIICDASWPTFMLTYWTRDRNGERIALADAVKAMSHTAAQSVGLTDRGLIAPGFKADLNVIDYYRLKLRLPEVANDLPAGGKRVIQPADGYVATIVAGKPTYREGYYTGALPGRLVRLGAAGPHREPA